MVAVADRRSEKRVVVAFRVKLKYPDLDTFVERYAKNVSRKGVFVASKKPRPKGTKVRFELLLSDGTAALKGEGVVQWVKPFDPDHPKKPHGMGIKFTKLTPESQEVLDRILSLKESRSPAAADESAAVGPQSAEGAVQEAVSEERAQGGEGTDRGVGVSSAEKARSLEQQAAGAEPAPEQDVEGQVPGQRETQEARTEGAQPPQEEAKGQEGPSPGGPEEPGPAGPAVSREPAEDARGGEGREPRSDGAQAHETGASDSELSAAESGLGPSVEGESSLGASQKPGGPGSEGVREGPSPQPGVADLDLDSLLAGAGEDVVRAALARAKQRAQAAGDLESLLAGGPQEPLRKAAAGASAPEVVQAGAGASRKAEETAPESSETEDMERVWAELEEEVGRGDQPGGPGAEAGAQAPEAAVGGRQEAPSPAEDELAGESTPSGGEEGAAGETEGLQALEGPPVPAEATEDSPVPAAEHVAPEPAPAESEAEPEGEGEGAEAEEGAVGVETEPSGAGGRSGEGLPDPGDEGVEEAAREALDAVAGEAAFQTIQGAGEPEQVETSGAGVVQAVGGEPTGESAAEAEPVEDGPGGAGQPAAEQEVEAGASWESEPGEGLEPANRDEALAEADEWPDVTEPSGRVAPQEPVSATEGAEEELFSLEDEEDELAGPGEEEPISAEKAPGAQESGGEEEVLADEDLEALLVEEEPADALLELDYRGEPIVPRPPPPPEIRPSQQEVLSEFEELSKEHTGRLLEPPAVAEEGASPPVRDGFAEQVGGVESELSAAFDEIRTDVREAFEADQDETQVEPHSEETSSAGGGDAKTAGKGIGFLWETSEPPAERKVDVPQFEFDWDAATNPRAQAGAETGESGDQPDRGEVAAETESPPQEAIDQGERPGDRGDEGDDGSGKGRKKRGFLRRLFGK